MTFDSSLPLLVAQAASRGPLVPLWVLELAWNVFLYLWLFAVGASVGSFLNVVVYRLPRKKNLAHPGSFCPRCRSPIRLRDNIPLLSWLLLRGRCRDCGSPIPPRYVLVELAVAVLFVTVAAFALQAAGSFPRPYAAERRAISVYEPLPFWSAYALHVGLLTTLLGAALIDASGHRTPRRMFGPVLLAGFTLPLIWPAIRRLPAFSLQLPAWQIALIDGLAGIVAGAVLGLVIGAAWSFGARTNWPRFAPAIILATIGAVLGWQSTLLVAAAGALLFAAISGILRRRGSEAFVPFAACMLFVTLLHVAGLDRDLVPRVVPRLTHDWPAAVLLVALAGLTAGRWTSPRLLAAPPDDPPEVEIPSPEPEIPNPKSEIPNPDDTNDPSPLTNDE